MRWYLIYKTSSMVDQDNGIVIVDLCLINKIYQNTFIRISIMHK